MYCKERKPNALKNIQIAGKNEHVSDPKGYAMNGKLNQSNER